MNHTAQKRIPVFKSEFGAQQFSQAYDQLMTYWPCHYETMEISTQFGSCHVIVCGPEEGEPVLMFHGMTSNSAMWYPTVEALTNYRVYCIDTPGDFGKSHVTTGMRSSEDAVLWMDQVMEALGLATAIFIGHSMGGWFCSNYATKRSERIVRLVLLAPVATFLPVPFLKFLLKIYPAMLLPSPARIRRAWSWFCRQGYTLPPHVMDVIIAAYRYGRPQLQVVPRVIDREEWRKLTAPVLFLVGDEEKIYNAADVLERVREAIPHAEVIQIHGAGHCLIIEQQDVVNEAIQRFLVN